MHFTTLVLAAAAAGAAIAVPTQPVKRDGNSTSDNQGLIDALLQAPTAVDRIALLPDDSDFKFDFNNPPGTGAITQGDGGHTVKADRKGFPALIGTGVSMTVGFLGPCGFNTPHVHPRSSEINIVVQGQLSTEFIAENGARAIRNNLTQYQMTVFPQAAIHTEWNPTCDNAVFVAGFASEDPGVQQSAQGLFGLDDPLIEAVLGVGGDPTFDGKDIDTFKHLIPANVALGVESCLAACNIQRNKKRDFRSM